MYTVPRYTVILAKEEYSGYNTEKITVDSVYNAYENCREIFDYDSQCEEVFGMLCLDTKNSIIGSFEVSRGSLNCSIVHPREVFKRAIALNSSSIILTHNHPSGNTEPSPEDIALTNRLVECGKMLGTNILDHVIIGDNYFSFKEEGYI